MKKLILAVVILIVLLSVSVMFWVVQSTPGNEPGNFFVEYTEPTGTSSSVIPSGGSTPRLERERFVRERFAYFRENPADTTNWQWDYFTDETGVVPLSIGLEALEATLPTELVPFIEQGTWGVSHCAFSSENETPSYILR
jgi:hypothetical protein